MVPHWPPLFAALLFLAAYLLIFFNLGKRLLIIMVALISAAALLLSGILTTASLFQAIDWNILGVVLGMDALILSLEDNGFFRHLYPYFTRHARHPWRFLVLFLTFSALIASLLNNVSTVLAKENRLLITDRRPG